MSTTRAPLGVLLMTYGSPADLDDMPRYLAAVRGGRPASDDLVAEFRRRYEVIGGSPLIPITQAQAAAVERRLSERGSPARVVAAMRFSRPSIAEGLADIASDRCDPVVAIVMSPQYSERLMSGYRRALDEAYAGLDSVLTRPILAPAWYRQPKYIAAVAQRIREALDPMPAGVRDALPVLLTAHSVPRHVAENEPGYIEQLRETARLVARRAGLRDERWEFCWQSAGHEPGEWMKPDFADLMPALRSAGHRGVLVAPIQFLSDHLEVLYDIDVGAREQATRAGMAFSRIESLNVTPAFVDALADVALETAGVAAVGR
jgi:protoporphyrin/coproporphyrin ferrochelatase